MYYYIDTIEQTKGQENGTINEYGKREIVKEDGKPAGYQTVLSKFFKKLSDVSADIGKNHYFMDIRIVNSLGGTIKKDSVGQYVEAELPSV